MSGLQMQCKLDNLLKLNPIKNVLKILAVQRIEFDENCLFQLFI